MLTNYVEGYQHIGIPTDDIKKKINNAEITLASIPKKS